MPLSPHSLRQLDPAYLYTLDEAALRVLSVMRLEDLREAWDRLNQGPENSSRPPSRRAPWERKGGGREPGEDPEDDDREPEAAVPPAEVKPEKTPSGEAKPAEVKAVEVPPAAVKSARKAGKQPGAPGIGRTQVLQAHHEQPHHPDVCAGCGRGLERAGAGAYTLGFRRWICVGGGPGAAGLDPVGGGPS